METEARRVSGKHSCESRAMHSKSAHISRPSELPNSLECLSNSDCSFRSLPSEPQSVSSWHEYPESPSVDSLSTRKPSEATQCSITSLQSPLMRSLVSPTKQPITDAIRPALFDDHVAPSYVPGSLHLVADSTIERLISRLGAVPLIRQLAEDLAHRDKELVMLQQKATERERALRKMLVEVEVSNADIERRLASCSAVKVSRENASPGTEESFGTDAIDQLMKQAMGEDTFGTIDSEVRIEDTSNMKTPKPTLRVHKATAVADNASTKSTSSQKSSLSWGWKGLIWGQRQDLHPTAAEYYRSLQNDSSVMRRKGLPNDLFTPHNYGVQRSSSRSSLASFSSDMSKTHARSKHLSLQTDAHGAPTLALKSPLAAAEFTRCGSPPSEAFYSKDIGGGASWLEQSSIIDMRRRRILDPPTQIASRHSKSKQPRIGDVKDDLQWIITKSTSKRNEIPRKRTISMSSNTGSTKGINSNSGWLASTITDRAAIIVPLATSQMVPKLDVSPGPVEMETFHSVQPPTLIPSWNEQYRTDYLTDRFGFIYDKKQKDKVTDSAKLKGHPNPSSSEIPLLGSGPSSNSGPATVADNSSQNPITRLTSNNQAKDSTNSNHELGSESFPVTRSPTISTGSKRNIRPQLSTLQAPLALRSRSGTTMVEESKVKSLLDQLTDLHESLQRDRGAKWDEFIRKIRAEKRKCDGDISEMPEAALADSELIVIATLGNSGKGGKQTWREFRKLVLAGIPVSYRGKIWAECSGASALRVPGYYDEILETGEDDPLVISQISMDVNRTLTDNVFFRQGPGVTKLRKVLLAYSRRNPEVGYCQGMNMIAASLLLITPTDEDAFWILVSIVENILPKTYFEQNLLASRADQQVLKQYVREILPQLHGHLSELGVELEALTFQWFLTIFTDCLAAEALYRVWDVLLCLEGSTFLFQTALALLRLNEKPLLECNSAAAVYSYLNSHMTHQGISIDGLIQASDLLRQQIKKEDVDARRTAAIERELAPNNAEIENTARVNENDLEGADTTPVHPSQVGGNDSNNKV